MYRSSSSKENSTNLVRIFCVFHQYWQIQTVYKVTTILSLYNNGTSKLGPCNVLPKLNTKKKLTLSQIYNLYYIHKTCIAVPNVGNTLKGKNIMSEIVYLM